MSQKSTIKYFSDNGDIVNWTIDVSNLTQFKCYNAVLSFYIPEGVKLYGPKEEGSSQIIVPKGTFNPSEIAWKIGDLEGNEEVQANFIFQVTDKSLVDDLDKWFKVEILLTSSCSEKQTCNNRSALYITLEEDSCGDIVVRSPKSVSCSTNLKVQ